MRVNCLAPTAATLMTEDLISKEMLAAFAPEFVTPALLYLVSENAPTRTILNAGAGTFAATHLTLTQGLHLGLGPDTDSVLAARIATIVDRTGDVVPASGAVQGGNELEKRRLAQDGASLL